ncbi:tetratricopeptide repeat protein [Pseudobacteriovorax antillogorgiicola]|uniref:Coatomer epsilon subunit n=1 Tax=Pseudobacteriovorax antillogorgiicola TaxID=1513793 RepID=A0A1Y6C9B0_9BACT|nr:tetratricopeptide repeat protein [Pseudobacteriovorax antillogorgiicola]TCS51692.1 coatomer epsilon subunit [Pseudobacteriovorax antillogorgiicola]SMF49119.1 Coatomer epsilon subunit [Pseudobacteriovorax antillogorgiicola]
MENAESNHQDIDTFHEAIVAVTRESLRMNITAELKKHGTSHIVTTDTVKDITRSLSEFPNAILVIDFEIGHDAVVQVLEKARCPYKADVRPMYLICKSLERDVVALATDYHVLRLRAGEITGDDIHKDIHDIYVYEHMSEDSRMMLHQVSELREKGKWEEAGVKLMQSLEKDASNVKLKVELAENLIFTNEHKAALKLLDEILAERPKHIRALSLKARIQMKQGNFDDAAAMLQEVQLFNPDNVERLVDLGQCLLNLDRVKEANGFFDQALKIDEDSVQAARGKGQVSLLQGDLEAALGFFKSSTEEEIAALFNNTAIMCMRKGRFEQGLKLYHTALTQVVKKPETLARVVFNMGLGYLKWEKPDHACKAFKQATSLDPQFEKASHNLRILQKRTKPQVAETSADIIDMGESVGAGNEGDAIGEDIAEMFGSGLELDDSLFESLAQG